MHIKINFDGAINHAPEFKHMGLGIAVFLNNIYCEKSSNFILKEGTAEELGTSNISEWGACVEAMRKAASMRLTYPHSCIEVYSDSQLISSQFNGQYEIKKPEFKAYFDKAHRFANIAGVQRINWVKRELNNEADRLSKIALEVQDEGTDQSSTQKVRQTKGKRVSTLQH